MGALLQDTYEDQESKHQNEKQLAKDVIEQVTMQKLVLLNRDLFLFQ